MMLQIRATKNTERWNPTKRDPKGYVEKVKPSQDEEVKKENMELLEEYLVPI